MEGQKELCVRCNRPTPYDQSTPVTARHYFVEGSGQLCVDCWRKLYENSREVAIFDRRTNDS